MTDQNQPPQPPGRDTNPLPPYQYQPYQGPPRPPRKPWSRRRHILTWSVVGFFLLVGTIGSLTSPPQQPAAHHGPVIPAVAHSSSPIATPAVTHTTTPPVVHATTPAPQHTTTQPAPVHSTTQPAPQHTTTAPPPPPPSCYPTTSTGHCYEPGEFCSNAEHGMTGVAGDGKAIKCENTDPGQTWHWVDI